MKEGVVKAGVERGIHDMSMNNGLLGVCLWSHYQMCFDAFCCSRGKRLILLCLSFLIPNCVGICLVLIIVFNTRLVYRDSSALRI